MQEQEENKKPCDVGLVALFIVPMATREDMMERDERIRELAAGMEGWTPALVGMLADADPVKRLQGRYVAAGILADKLSGEWNAPAGHPALV